SGTDEIRQIIQQEAANAEEERNMENNIQSESSSGQAVIPRHSQERGHRRGGRGRNANFFRHRYSEDHPLLHMMRQVNRHNRTRRNRNQQEERQLQPERNQFSFRRFHGRSRSHDRHISRSHGLYSRRSHSRFRRAPIHSDRSHVYSGRTDNHTDRPHHDISGRPHHDLSDRPHHDLSDRPHPDLSDRPHHDLSDRPHHDLSDR
ncbi:leucine zipper protein 4, partial [Grammomys surdaster]|uniref:leucine zipper protein 4 n=1 Tax=Grammomys surdaster TaxID=491861 RepID=UPI00109F9CD0